MTGDPGGPRPAAGVDAPASPGGDRRSIAGHGRLRRCCCTSSAGASWSSRSRRTTTGWAAPASSGVGVGLTAYMLGVRHAFDADHIASIDNTTRKLVGEGTAVGQRRVLVLPRPLLGRLRRQPAAGRRGALGRRRRPERGLRRSAPTLGAGRHDRRRHVPAADRPDEPRRRRRHRPGLPADAHGRVRRGRARAAPAQPRLPQPGCSAG